jgi:oxygen-independent coproporphyrinogen-3 oxidase
VANTYNPVKAYLELLKAEMTLVSRTLKQGHSVTHIHWGGGSPTILKPEDIEGLTAHIRRTFDVAHDAEFAVEIDPRTITSDMAEAFRKAGVNRASLGVQDCDPLVLQAVNRMQTIETTRNAVDMLRKAGVTALNIDLMYGLPHQTVDGIRKTIDAVMDLAPDRLAVFGYAHLPSFKAQQGLIDEAALPGLEERLEQYETGRQHLLALGYVAVGLDHFAKPSDPMAIALRDHTLTRNFQGYTTDAAPALIGIGSSAISAFPQGYTQNAVPMPAYRKAILAGEFATAKGVEISRDDELRRTIISELMCYGETDLADVSGRFGRRASDFAPELKSLSGLEHDGLVELSGPVVRIPKGAHAAVRVVCAEFDRYLAQNGNRHATAV